MRLNLFNLFYIYNELRARYHKTTCTIKHFICFLERTIKKSTS